MPNLRNINPLSSETRLPTAYTIKEIVMTNHKGTEYDIQALVTDFTITESIYRPALMLSMNIKDPVNLLEEGQFIGQEKITVKLAARDFTDDGTINSDPEANIVHTFYVTEYPVYGKYNNLMQVYSIRGISEFAYLSKLKRISRAFSGNMKKFVESVLQRDLRLSSDKLYIADSAGVNSSFIVPNMNPVDAIVWALRRCYDERHSSPFYCYQILNGQVRLESQADIASKESYEEYIDAKFFQFNAMTDTEEDYNELSRRILSITSDLKMSKLMAGMNGAYASRTDYLDLSTKTVSRSVFDLTKELPDMVTIENESPVSTQFTPEENLPLTKYDLAKINYIPMNSMAFGSGVAGNYHASTINGRINRAQAYSENLETISHDIVLTGDFNLNAGMVISLRLPPSFDPNTRKLNIDQEPNTSEDRFFSGDYQVVSVSHNFAEDYTMEVKVKRDSFTRNYSQ